MLKPKIVLVDDDIRYIFLLQAKIGEFFLNDIDLEVITEHEYYLDYFSKPKTIDLLIIDEKFYGSSIELHSIRKTLLLTEDEGAANKSVGNVLRLYKYTNIREIFSVINSREIGLSTNISSGNGTQVLLVTSAAGGVGKSTVALGLSMALEKDYKKVLYVDAEYFQTFFYLMDNPELIDGNKLIEIPKVEDMLHYLKSHIANQNMSYLPAFKVPILSSGIGFEIYKLFVEEIKKSEEYDFIIIDSDSSFNEEKIQLMGCADKVLFVTDQSKKGCYATNQLLKHISGVDNRKYLFICNKCNAHNTTVWKSIEKDLDFSISEYVENYVAGELDLKNSLALTGVQRIAFLLQ